MHVRNAQSLIPFTHRFGTSPGNNGHMQARLDSQLQGIPVFDIDRTHRFPSGMQRNGLGTQHTVHVESQRLYLP